MKVNSMVSKVVLSTVCALSLATLAEAQATRTWVSGVGDDANPCSRTAPCKTFAGAISKTADKGFIHVLDPGGFGAVTITKNITIDGTPFMAGVLISLGSSGININGSGIKVTLRGLDIEGITTGNHGINVITAGEVHVENTHITGFAGNAINWNTGTPGQLFVNNVTIRNTGGIQVTNGRASINALRAEGGVFGVRANTSSIITVRDSFVAGASEGFTTTVGSGVMNLESCVTTNNGIGIDVQGGGVIRISNTMIWSNSSTGIFTDGNINTSALSLSGNSLQGNTNNGAFTGAAIPKQ